MTILYLIGRIITVPGAYLKAFWEHLLCRILRVPTGEPRYLRLDEMLGHIEHDLPSGTGKSFLFCAVSGLLNALLGLPMLLTGTLGLFYLGVGYSGDEKSPVFWVYLIMLYFGIALLSNIFPLAEDALYTWGLVFDEKTPFIVKALLFIPCAVLIGGAYIERYAAYLPVWAALILAASYL